jgi:DNA polymerase III epsilon subunit-like protein
MGDTIFYDYETGGLEPHHPNIQLAAIAVDSDFDVLETFEAKIAFDPAKAQPEALAMNHYDPAKWANAEHELNVTQRFAQFCSRYADIPKVSKRGRTYYVAQLGGHNVSGFDFQRLQRAAKSFSIFLPADYHMMDTLQGAIWYFKFNPPAPKSFRLGALCEHFGVTPEGDLHDALTDVKASIAVAKYLSRVWRRTARETDKEAGHPRSNVR